MAYPEWIDVTERTIITRILNDAFLRGWYVSVFDGEETVVTMSRNMDEITDNIGQTDETTLRLRTADKALVGNIWLIHGNTIDVVGDYSTSIDDFMDPINAWVEGEYA